MTNEEKAREIANEYCYWEDRDEDEAIKVAIEMAEWKDRQFKEYLEQFISRCEMTAGTVVAYDMYGAEVNEKYAECVRKIINELFKED